MPQRSDKWNGHVEFLLSGKNVRDSFTSHLPLIETSGWIWSQGGKTYTTHNSAVTTIWADICTRKKLSKESATMGFHFRKAMISLLQAWRQLIMVPFLMEQRVFFNFTWKMMPAFGRNRWIINKEGLLTRTSCLVTMPRAA